MNLKYTFHFISLIVFLAVKPAWSQTVFIDDLPQTPAPSFKELSNIERKSQMSPMADSYLPNQMSKSLNALSQVLPQKCEDPSSYTYTLSLTVRGNYDACIDYVDNCLKKFSNIPVATAIQGARCAKAQYKFAKAYEIFEAGRKSNDFKGENASALILEFALFAQYTIYPGKTDDIIALHPTWTTDEKDSVKSLVQFLGKTTPVKKSKDQVFQFVDAQINNSHDFLARLLKTYRVALNLNEYRFAAAYDYLLKDVITLVNPLDWWQQSFQSLYSLSENADFARPLSMYKSFIPYANKRSFLPTEQNVYNYTQIYNSACKDTMLQGADYSALQNDLSQWKTGALPLANLIAKIEAENIQQSNKSDLLSTYAGLLVISGQKEKALEYYWKAQQSCPFNNRSHWGLVLLDRKNRYAAYPEFATNVKKLQDTVAQITFPPEIADYVLNWKALPAASQERVKYGARIWAPFMKDLSDADYKVYIKSPFELLSASPGFENSRDSRIGPPDMPSYKFDNRLWDDVRGAGGQHVIADHDESFETVQGDYNLLGHEITHQFHAYLNVKYPSLGDCVEKLYANAQKNKSFPDPYAASNSREYFAQGITYFLIPADAPARYGINSSWYPKNDPMLLAFMVSIQNSNGDFSKIQCPF
jgi:hypothetical protein